MYFFLSNSILIKLFVETIDVTILSKYFSRKSIGFIFTIINYLKNTDPLHIPSIGDTLTFIDNNQVRKLAHIFTSFSHIFYKLVL